MKLLDKNVQKALRSFAETVKLNQGTAYLVGGTVRDGLLGVTSKDVDVEVHGIEPEALRKIIDSHFSEVKEVGKAFGVLHTYIDETDIDISLPRRDSKTGPGHKGFDVNVDPHLSVEEALRRRDFTMNALLQDILSEELIDPFGGVADLESRVLRIVDAETFVEDPLRVLRAVQMVGRFALTVDEATLRLLEETAPRLVELTDDRTRVEWEKLFLRAEKPSLGLELAFRIGVFAQTPIIERLSTTSQDPVWHPEGDVWTHTKWVVDEAVRIAVREALDERDRLTVVLGGLCHDLGKPQVTKEVDGRVRSKGHSEAGVEEVDALLSHLGLGRFAEAVKPLVLLHLQPYYWFDAATTGEGVRDGALRRAAREVRPATLRLLSYVTEADLSGRGPYPEGLDHRDPACCVWLRERAEALDLLDGPPENVIRGNDLLALGHKPGPHFGLVIRAANRVHDEEDATKQELLERIETDEAIVTLTSEDEMVERLQK